MKRGKQTCKILKEIRKQIAEENDIELVTSECTYQGDCKGTCPKCEAEVRYLERELEKRQRMGKAAIFAGMSLGAVFASAGCGPLVQRTGDVPNDTYDTSEVVQDTIHDEFERLAGEPCVPDINEMTNDSIQRDTIPDEPFMLEGDVLVPVDSLKVFVFEPVEDEERPGVYIVVDQMPEFPSGDKGLYQFIADNIKYPAEAKEEGIKGRVFVNFIVEPDGSVSDIRVLRGIGGGCDEEAVRVVKSMPRFKPGMQDGETVRVSYTIPVFFRLEDKQD